MARGTHDTRVGRGQVDAETTGARAEAEDEDVGVGLPRRDHVAALADGRGAVEAEVLVPPRDEELLDQVERARHLEV
jgi:hypothetical protein